MKKTCGNCVFMLDDKDGSAPYCAIKDLYTDVQPTDKACEAWAGTVNKEHLQELKNNIRGY